MAADDDVPVVVFEGEDEDAVFLVSLLGSGDIIANTLPRTRWRPARVLVRRRDAADARDLVADVMSRLGKR